MPSTRKNKIQVPSNSDAWNLVPDLTTMADTANVIIPVSSAAERDAIASPANGQKVARLDQDGAPLNSYDSATSEWLEPYISYGSPQAVTGFTTTGEWYGIRLGDRTLIIGAVTMLRTGSNVAIPGGNVAYTDFGIVAPTGAYGGTVSESKHWQTFVAGNGRAEEFQFLYEPSTGRIKAKGAGGVSVTWWNAAQTGFQVVYMI